MTQLLLWSGAGELVAVARVRRPPGAKPRIELVQRDMWADLVPEVAHAKPAAQEPSAPRKRVKRPWNVATSRALALDTLDAIRLMGGRPIEATWFATRFTGSQQHEARRKHWARWQTFLRGSGVPHDAGRAEVLLGRGALEVVERLLGDPLAGIPLRGTREAELDREDEAAQHDPEVIAALEALRGRKTTPNNTQANRRTA